MTDIYVDCMFGGEGNPFGDEPLFHHVGMPKGPPATQKSLSVDHAMKWELAAAWRTRNRPADLPAAAGISEGSCDVTVCCHHSRRNLGNDRKDLLGESQLSFFRPLIIF